MITLNLNSPSGIHNSPSKIHISLSRIIFPSGIGDCPIWKIYFLSGNYFPIRYSTLFNIKERIVFILVYVELTVLFALSSKQGPQGHNYEYMSVLLIYIYNLLTVFQLCDFAIPSWVYHLWYSIV